MLFTVILFWISLSVLFFCYLGYGLILLVYNRLVKLFSGDNKQGIASEWLPSTIIITAYNEAAILEKKVQNTLAIDYPADKLEIIFVTDGSTDGSENIIKNYPRLILLHHPDRKGKPSAINRAMQLTSTPVVIFSDANSELNKDCIRRIVRHYDDPAVGGVAGEKKIIENQKTTAVGQAEGLYWKYESFMKKQDADFNTVVGAAGELFSIRTNLFTALDDNIILDDFIISMNICLKGYKIGYEPGAFATEFPSATLSDEEKRKVRISAGAYQSIARLKKLFNIFKYPLLSFQYISRRLLRWVICPAMLVVLLVTNIIIVEQGDQPVIFTIGLVVQVCFYLLAMAGWITIRSGGKSRILTIPFYFVFMNYCLVRGLIRFLKRKQTVLWEKSSRQLDD